MEYWIRLRKYLRQIPEKRAVLAAVAAVLLIVNALLLFVASVPFGRGNARFSIGRAEPEKGSSGEPSPVSSEADATKSTKSKSQGGSGTARTSTARRAKGANPPGVTDTEIRFGIMVQRANEAAAQSLGLNVPTSGDRKAQFRYAINDINARGLFGRKIVPVFAEFDVTGDRGEVQEQAICSGWTEDTQVFAALTSVIVVTDTLRGCLHNKGVVHLAGSGVTTTDAATYERFPHYAEGGSLNLSRVSTVYVEALAAQGYFEGSSPLIGLVTYDNPSWARAADDVLKPALGRLGLRIEEFRTTRAVRVSEFGPLAASMQSAVLRFNTLGINRVLFLDDGNAALFFMNHAQSQGYNPRYGFSTQNLPDAQRNNVPAAQLRGALGVGWVPSSDLAGADRQTTPDQKRCLDIMRANGDPVSSAGEQSSANKACNDVGVFAAALEAGGPDISADSFIRGLESLGTNVKSLVALSLRYGPGRRDGVAGVRNLGFLDNCNCWRYTSELRPV